MRALSKAHAQSRPTHPSHFPFACSLRCAIRTLAPAATIPSRSPFRFLSPLFGSGWAAFGRFPGRLRRPQPRGRPRFPGLGCFACSLQGFFFTVSDRLRFEKEEAAHETGDVRSMVLRDEVGTLALFGRDPDREKKRAHLQNFRRRAMAKHVTQMAITQTSMTFHIPNVYTIRGAGATRTSIRFS